MNTLSTSLRSFIAVIAAAGLLSVGLAGCGGESNQDTSQQLNMVTVNWIEGMAFTYVQEQILEDRYDLDVDVREVQGGGLAFSSVADGDRDYFNEAWLPTTHAEPWSKAKGNADKLGYTYKGTSVGFTVPAYMDITGVTELPEYRDELNGEINGIESGSAVNDQTRQILKNNNIEGFSVVASSGPATWQALENAVQNKEPIVVTGWYPHWKWGSFDLKYLEGAQTGQTSVFGAPEDVFKIVDNEFVEEFPKDAVCFLKVSEVNDEQIESLMDDFRNRGDMSKREAASQWVENNSDGVVSQWMEQAEECASSEGSVETLSDDASFSRNQSDDMEGNQSDDMEESM